LIVRPDPGTDFWQRTHYGFEADNGHFLYLPVTGDFVLTTQVRSQPVHQYDQAGLMVRVSEGCWLKTSIEYEPEGPNRLGAVVTNGQYSDWSTQSIGQDIEVVWLRVRGEAGDYIVESSLDGTQWQQIRMARLLDRPSADGVCAGVYACSPKQAGMQATFSFIECRPGRLSA
jgi:regulation of enolase protein 1 (concanavalin A-like superfamily)